ncbi:MAG: lactonase family protein, partial [Burkholderiales bacterium]|nr:lactonase family protein [Burkholderiales bacterium]
MNCCVLSEAINLIILELTQKLCIKNHLLTGLNMKKMSIQVFLFIAVLFVTAFSIPNSQHSLLNRVNNTVITDHPQDITLSSNGKFTYVVNSGSNSISMYSVSGEGKLSPLNPATISTESYPTNIIISPNGKYAYVVNYWANSISMYYVENNGQLVALSPASITTGNAPSD